MKKKHKNLNIFLINTKITLLNKCLLWFPVVFLFLISNSDISFCANENKLNTIDRVTAEIITKALQNNPNYVSSIKTALREKISNNELEIGALKMQLNLQEIHNINSTYIKTKEFLDFLIAHQTDILIVSSVLLLIYCI